MEGNSGICTVIVETFTRESRNLGYPGVALKWDARDPEAVESLASGSKPDLVVAHLGIPRERIEKVLQTAAKAGIDTLFNPSPAVAAVSATCRNVTHLVLNEHEAAELVGRRPEELATPAAWKAAADRFIALGVKNVVITLAEKGVYYATHDGKSGKVDAVQDVDVKDTTGAG